MSRLRSILNLAFEFNLHMLRRPFAWSRCGKEQFLAQYLEDNLIPFTLKEREVLSGFQRCITCGLCDAVCPAPDPLQRHLLLGPSDFPSCFLRHPSEAEPLRPTIELLEQCLECKNCQQVCPQAVPLNDIAGFLKKYFSRVKG